MTTNEFISALRNTPENELIFVNDAGHAIHAGYHLTEVKAAHFDTVDCGGQTNRWNETVVQLWVPVNAEDEEGYMTTRKFLSIFDRVTTMIPLDLGAELRVEYGDRNFFPLLYHVETVTSENGTTHVSLRPPQATCKARDRRRQVEAGACCEAACC
jgi:hypothetical protein